MIPCCYQRLIFFQKHLWQNRFRKKIKEGIFQWLLNYHIYKQLQYWTWNAKKGIKSWWTWSKIYIPKTPFCEVFRFIYYFSWHLNSWLIWLIQCCNNRPYWSKIDLIWKRWYIVLILQKLTYNRKESLVMCFSFMLLS